MEPADTQLLRVLVVRGPRTEQADMVRWLSGQAHVEVVDSLEHASQALDGERFDIVVADARDFLSLERSQLTGQATAILETVAQGISIVDRTGRLVWSNAKMLEYPAEVRDRVCQWCAETFRAYDADPARAAAPQPGRRFWMTTSDGHYLEITATPVMDLQKKINHVAAVVWDATQARRLREKINAIDRAGTELVRFDAEQISRLNAPQRLELIEQKIIRCTRDLMQLDNFAVRVLDRRTNRLDLVLAAGMPTEAQNLDIYAEAEGNGICGYVAATGRSYICADVQNDPRYLMGIPNARASLTVPLRLHDQVVGVFNVESDRPAAFGEDDRQFAEIFARHVALSLHILNLLDTERYVVTGRVARDVLAEITGPLNDILTETAELTEEYIGHDEFRRRLNRITDSAVKIRETIKQLTQPPRGVITSRTAGRRPSDPILSGKSILVVDDEDVIRETVRDILSSEGCRVAIAADAPEAVELIRTHPFDLVLSDIKMPVGNGYAVFAAAKDVNRDCPVILMTGFGYDPNHAIVRARQEGLTAVLFKPFKVEQLVGEVRNALTVRSERPSG